MASITDPPMPPTPLPPPGRGVRFERVGEAGRREALSVLLSGRRDANHPAVRPFLDFAAKNGLELDHLWVAWDGKRMAAAAMIVPGVGRTAMLFLSPVASGGRVDLSGQLIAHAIAALDPQRICLVQALLEQGQKLQQRALEAGGLRFLAELAYMQRAGRALDPLPLVTLNGNVLEKVHWSESARPLFADAIQQSYQGTRDCPGLLGLRHIDDIIAGHRSTGKFNPNHWTIWKDEANAPAAVLLLAESSQGMGFELVYLGVSPHARQRGLSKVLMHHALDVAAGGREKPAASTHAGGNPAELYLAVDDRNQPAMRLYRGLGFRVSLRKTALIATPGQVTPPILNQ